MNPEVNSKENIENLMIKDFLGKLNALDYEKQNIVLMSIFKEIYDKRVSELKHIKDKEEKLLYFQNELNTFFK